MTTMQDIELDMPICYDGMVRGGDDKPLKVYRMRINTQWNWFIGTPAYEPDGNQFAITVSYFGLKEKTLAGSTGNQYRRVFDVGAKEVIKKRIQDFFLGSEEKLFFPFNDPKARCIGVRFNPIWILTS
jgi:hypothetical protein